MQSAFAGCFGWPFQTRKRKVDARVHSSLEAWKRPVVVPELHKDSLELAATTSEKLLATGEDTSSSLGVKEPKSMVSLRVTREYKEYPGTLLEVQHSRDQPGSSTVVVDTEAACTEICAALTCVIFAAFAKGIPSTFWNV